jgi:endonuclease YncB( thermonuclease family)
MIRIAFILALTTFYTLPVYGEIAGPARVIDGDTIEIALVHVRLFGIDAPESNQTCERSGIEWLCGAEAAKHLRQLIGNSPVSCEVRGADRYSRTVAVCRAGGVDLNAAMVLAGMALAYRKYSSDYVTEEVTARSQGVGLWAGSFADPWIWRRDTKAQSATVPAVPASQASANCLIKGNVGYSGKRIYHMPGTQDYEKTKISLDRGERWFCTEADAEAAGWRKAGSP